MNDEQIYPVVDLHCDLTDYLATVEGATPNDTEGIGCAIPYLRQGNVALQVMAISSVATPPSAAISSLQIEWYKKLVADYGDTFTPARDTDRARTVRHSGKVGIVPAIENASVLCGPDDPLDDAFVTLQKITQEIGRPLYISLTHHGENRFGGGNMTGLGLKDDGRRLLDHISGMRIAVDLSHTSDALAHGILDHVDANHLDIPVMASHSNFRQVYNHLRNLPDDLADEIIARQGLIGVNFVRAFVHPENPEYLTRHIIHGLDLGGAEAIAIGADYFSPGTHPDPDRMPYYFAPHEHAGKYQSILGKLTNELGMETVEAIAYGNAMRFMEQFYYEV